MTDTSPGDSSRGLDATTLRKGATIAGLVLAVLMPVVGLVVSVATYIWAKRSGEGGGLSVVGIVVSVVLMIATVLVGFFLFTQLMAAAQDGALNFEALCAHQDRWGWLLDSLRYVCR